LTDRQLRYIITIAEEGSITAAAKKLFISQPSLSSLLLHVESQLGVKLFDRTVSPMILTYAGEKYIEFANKSLSLANELDAFISDIKGSRKGRIRIGCGAQQSSFVTPLILPQMIKKYPEVEFLIYEKSKTLLEEDLVSGKIDILIGGWILNHEGLTYEELKADEFVLFAPKGFKATTLGNDEKSGLPLIDLSSLVNEKFILMKKDRQLRLMQNNILKGLNFEPNILLETDDWLTSLRMVESGVAFTILPNADAMLKEDNHDKYALEKKYYRYTLLCYREDIYMSKVMIDFMDTARRVIKKG